MAGRHRGDVKTTAAVAIGRCRGGGAGPRHLRVGGRTLVVLRPQARVPRAGGGRRRGAASCPAAAAGGRAGAARARHAARPRGGVSSATPAAPAEAAPGPAAPPPATAAEAAAAPAPQPSAAPAVAPPPEPASVAKAPSKAQAKKKAKGEPKVSSTRKASTTHVAAAAPQPVPASSHKKTGDPLLDASDVDADFERELSGTSKATKRSVYVPPAPGSELPERLNEAQINEGVASRIDALKQCLEHRPRRSPTPTARTRWAPAGHPGRRHVGIAPLSLPRWRHRGRDALWNRRRMPALRSCSGLFRSGLSPFRQRAQEWISVLGRVDVSLESGFEGHHAAIEFASAVLVLLDDGAIEFEPGKQAA